MVGSAHDEFGRKALAGRRRLLDRGGGLSGRAAGVRRRRQPAAELVRVAEDGRGNGEGSQGLRAPGHACSYRSGDLPGLVCGARHHPRPPRTQDVRRRGRTRSLRRPGLIMLGAALIALLIAVLFGSWLAVLHFDGRTPERVPWVLALVHAALALGGFTLLALALKGPPRGADQGTAGFGLAAAVLLALAIAAGLAILLRFRVA